MKPRSRSLFFLWGLLGLLFVFSACGGKKEEPVLAAAPAPPPAEESAAEGSAAKKPPRIQIRSADNELVAVLRFDAAQPSIAIPAGEKRRLLRRRQTRDGHRWLERGEKEALALVRPTENGFVVRTSEDELLWRVRVTEDALLVTDKPSGPFPFELRRQAANRFQVTGDGVSLGEVVWKPGRKSVSVTNAVGEVVWKSPRGARSSAAFGSLLLPGDDSETRYVLLMELLLHG